MALEISSLKADLAQQNATWDAERSLNLSDRQKRRRLGYVPGPKELSLTQREASATANVTRVMARRPSAATRPASIDWRNYGGSNFITPIKDQGNCGSCVAFGTCATIEALSRIAVQSPTRGVDLSEAHLFYCYAAKQGQNCNTGWWPSNALDCIKKSGVADESSFPYTARNQTCGLSPDWQDKATRIQSWRQWNAANSMKNWLSSTGPLVSCFTVYEDFYDYRSGIYHHVTGNNLGGHCISVVGYDDNNQCWICKNSWGSSWGEAGFFRIRYGDCGIDATMWAPKGIVFPSLQTGDHFYTTSATERDNAVATYGYTDEGVACFVFGSNAANTTPLFRLLNASNSDHFYTTSAAERDNAVTNFGYQNEGVACFVFGSNTANTTPLFRLLKPDNGDHFYTTSAAERDNAVANFGYQNEGVACFVFDSASTGTIPFFRLLRTG